jgi:hypothetical protein
MATLSEGQKTLLDNTCIEIRDGCGRIMQSANRVDEARFKILQEALAKVREVVNSLRL